ncbi:hypothetical protein LOAG_02342 [Loa loa]|uniref:Uncharacterized protein n=1 Tax=Loa loa TaxID=7209 RepID=A0A1S0U8S0_LOALO|nr:hypothetical protein LOAG_02342 [Loa loa]EFO26138.1 hypothetical protein LOAG_02342 [Loa loa]
MIGIDNEQLLSRCQVITWAKSPRSNFESAHKNPIGMENTLLLKRLPQHFLKAEPNILVLNRMQFSGPKSMHNTKKPYIKIDSEELRICEATDAATFSTNREICGANLS